MDDRTPDSNSPSSEPSACSLPSKAETTALDAFKKSESEWETLLSAEQFRVMRQQGTEPPFRNELWNHKAPGLYLCAACAAPLFASNETFDSGTGWPSFYDSVESENVGLTLLYEVGILFKTVG